MPKPDEMRAPSTGVFISRLLALWPWAVEIVGGFAVQFVAIESDRAAAGVQRCIADVALLRGLSIGV